MKARIFEILGDTPEVQTTHTDHKRAALKTILEQIPTTVTISKLADLIGYSHEWVRSRLVEDPEYRKDIFQINGRYKIPRGVAEKFITTVFLP